MSVRIKDIKEIFKCTPESAMYLLHCAGVSVESDEQELTEADIDKLNNFTKNLDFVDRRVKKGSIDGAKDAYSILERTIANNKFIYMDKSILTDYKSAEFIKNASVLLKKYKKKIIVPEYDFTGISYQMNNVNKNNKKQLERIKTLIEFYEKEGIISIDNSGRNIIALASMSFLEGSTCLITRKESIKSDADLLMGMTCFAYKKAITVKTLSPYGYLSNLKVEPKVVEREVVNVVAEKEVEKKAEKEPEKAIKAIDFSKPVSASPSIPLKDVPLNNTLKLLKKMSSLIEKETEAYIKGGI